MNTIAILVLAAFFIGAVTIAIRLALPKDEATDTPTDAPGGYKARDERVDAK